MIIKKTINPFTTNSYILIQDGHGVLVDPVGDPEEFAKTLEENQAKCLGIVYTHGHYDHIASAYAFYQQFQVPLQIHSADREMFYFPEKNLSMYFSRNFSLEEDIPVKTFEDLEVLTFGGILLQVYHTPGHTPGSVCLQWESDLFTGDTLFEGSIGRTDFPGSDPKTMQSSLQKLKAMDPGLAIHPGHGDSSTIEEELLENPYMR